jgi:hypothetical protein
MCKQFMGNSRKLEVNPVPPLVHFTIIRSGPPPPSGLGVHQNQFLKFWIWPELEKSSSWNRNSFIIKRYMVICYFVCCQTVRHFQSPRRELANVRIKRLTIVKRHNEVLRVYIFLVFKFLPVLFNK